MRRPLLRRRVVDGDEATALIALRNRIKRVWRPRDFRGVVLGVLSRAIAEALGALLTPVAARIVRHAPDHEIADLRCLDAAHHQVHGVLVAEPGAEMAELRRP